MELTILGSGTAALQRHHGPSGYIVRLQGETCMLDGGSGALLTALQAGVSYFDIDKIFYSHLHPDHTIDLVPFLFGTKYTPGFTRSKKLSIYGPVGFRRFFEKLVALYGQGLAEVDYPLEILELGAESFVSGGFRVRTELMQHSENAVGYRFESAGRVLVYSGDTDFCQEIISLAKEADLLLIECSFPDDRKIAGHLTPTEVGQIAAEAEVKRVLLTHIYPPFEEGDILAGVTKRFSGDVKIARDLDKVII